MMKKFLILLLAIGSLVCSAQNNTATRPTGTLTSPSLVYNPASRIEVPAGSGATQPFSWSGVDVTQSTGGGTSGGNRPGYNATTNTYMFGYTQSTINYTYALSTALKDSGMTWLGYNYSWDYQNQGYTKGTLSANVTFNAANGTQLSTKNWTLGPTADGWQTVSGTETFASPAAVANINSFNLSFSGKDDRYWAGFYGPQVRNPTLSVLYTFDSCSTNTLSSPSCPGYAVAYKTQQCTANPLYDSTCPGYAAAYKTQQCTANPLYDTTCPGYADALKAQQCTLNPLSDTSCPNYQSYLNEQCKKDSLFSTKCEGYATAYAIKYLTNLDPAVTTAVNQQLTTINEVAKSDPAKVTVVNTTVDTVLSTPTTTTVTSTSPTSVTSVVNQTAPVVTSPVTPVANAVTSASTPIPVPPARQEERQQEQKKTDAEVHQVERKTGGRPDDVKKEVTQRAKDLARDAGRANTMERQVATQGLLVGLIGYVPGFTSYQQVTVPDTHGMELAAKYSKPTIDNRNAQRRLQGASDRMHQEMVDSQYKQ